MKGGYQIIDFGDVNITADAGITVTGIYNTIEGSFRKAIQVTGITLDGVEQRNCFVDCRAGANSFTFEAYGRTFTISNEDAVTVSAAA